MMVINNNIPALTTYGIVNNTSNALQKSIQKLSTGLRINSAADDAAGLSISEKMRAQINGLDRAVANAQDGVSLIQTAEGALTETHSILQRMRELSVQAANDTLTQQDRSYIQEEVDLLRDEIDHIGNTTTFNTKKLLNGDAAVLWSSDNLTTKAIVNGGLREVDQFGQKKSFEGNFKVTVKAEAGTAEVQKTDIMQVKHPQVGGRYTIDADAANKVASISGENLTDDVEYKLSIGANTTTTALTDGLMATTNSSSAIADDAFLKSALTAAPSYDLAFEVTSVTDNKDGTNAAASTATIHVSGFKTAADGKITEINKDVVLTSVAAATDSTGTADVTIDGEVVIEKAMTSKDNIAKMTVGDKAVWNLSAGGDLRLVNTFTGTDGEKQAHTVNLSNAVLGTANAGNTVTMKYMNLNKDTGSLSKETVTLKLDNADMYKTALATGDDIGTVRNYKIGEAAGSNVKLRDLSKFWDSQGNFMLEDPQTITINQGNGKTASVTLYGHDTLKDVEDKLNDAIANQLGQAQYVKDSNTAGYGQTTGATIKSSDHFVDYIDINDGGETGKTSSNTAGDIGRIDNAQAKETSSESVAGTFVIRSAVAGKDGTLRFATKNEDLLNALSLNTLTNATESTYTVSISDAHTGETVVEDTKITGNKLMGKLHENIDVEFDAMTGISSYWDTANRKFVTSGGSDTTTLHLADNTLTFQIGANEGDDMGINIGDMRSHALGLDEVLVTDRASASRSITVIDSAIDKVSTQRAKLGAYQNRLEHTMTNLSTSAENLTASESRIRDTDMAKEMMNFTKLQIMLQAGNSMLAQANQLPQNVLSLIR